MARGSVAILHIPSSIRCGGSLLRQGRERLEQLALVEEVAEVVEEPLGGAGAEQVHDLPLAVEQGIALGAEAVRLAAQFAELRGRVGDLARGCLRLEVRRGLGPVRLLLRGMMHWVAQANEPGQVTAGQVGEFGRHTLLRGARLLVILAARLEPQSGGNLSAARPALKRIARWRRPDPRLPVKKLWECRATFRIPDDSARPLSRAWLRHHQVRPELVSAAPFPDLNLLPCFLAGSKQHANEKQDLRGTAG